MATLPDDFRTFLPGPGLIERTLNPDLRRLKSGAGFELGTSCPKVNSRTLSSCVVYLGWLLHCFCRDS